MIWRSYLPPSAFNDGFSLFGLNNGFNSSGCFFLNSGFNSGGCFFFNGGFDLNGGRCFGLNNGFGLNSYGCFGFDLNSGGCFGTGKKGKMGSLGSSNLRGVFNGCGCNTSVDGCYGEFVFVNGCDGEVVNVDGGDKGFDLRGDRGDGQVGSLDTESQTVSNVVGGLDNAVGINIRVRSLNSGVSVADFVFLGVEVRIAVLGIAEFILSSEGRRGVIGGGDGGSSISSSDGGSSCVGVACHSVNTGVVY